MIAFYIYFGIFFLLAFSMPAVGFVNISSNKKAAKKEKADPSYKRPKRFFHRWEVWCKISRGEEVLKEYPISYWTFKFMARDEARFLNGVTLLHSLESLRDGHMTWADCEVRRLG